MRPRLRDPRATALIPGIANRDARGAFERRRDALLASIAKADTDAVRRALYEAVRLAIWRGGAVTGFDAFAENVLGLGVEEARDHAEAAATAAGQPLDQLSDE